MSLFEGKSGNFTKVRHLRILASASAFVALPFAFSSTGDEVIRTRNHRIYSLPFYRVPVPTDPLQKGVVEWGYGYTNANDFRELSTFSGKFSFEDAETQRFTVDYRRGIGRGWDVQVEIPYLTRGGGFVDPIIDWWHANVLKWSDGFRDRRAFGGSTVRFTGSQDFGSGSGIGDLSVTFQKKIADGTMASIGIKAPTGDAGELMGSGAWDAGFAVSKRWNLAKKWGATAQVGAVYQGVSDMLSPARRWVHQELVSFGYRPNSRDTWILQWQGEASALELGIPKSDRTHRVVTFGFKRKMSGRDSLEMYFSEDQDLLSGKFPELVNAGPDFTFGLRWAVRF